VPDDVPLAGPPDRLTPASAWLRRFWMWDLYFAAVAVSVAGYVAVVGMDRPVPARAVSVGFIAALALWYIGFGRRLARQQGSAREGYVYQAGVLALTVGAVTAVGSASFVLFALTPIAYMTLPLAPATGAVVVLNAIPSAVFLARTGDWAETVRGPLTVAVLVTISSMIIGTTIVRSEQQNEERQALIDELTSTRAEVTRLSHEAGAAAERQRLAGEIHDTIAQGLSSVVMLVQAAEADLERNPAQARRHLDIAARTARENLAEARALVAALTPTALDNASLADAVRRLVDRFAADTGVAASFDLAGATHPLPTGAAVVLLRAAQETLANVAKHAGAGSVRVSLSFMDGLVGLEVRDDGRGFDPDTPALGYGLAGMRRRAAQVGGAVCVTSREGAGTTVRVEVPA
jgi:signal transduction histidine kinase